jgi:hypothetical protein
MIIERIHDRSCVPFLGSAVNASAAGYEGLPLGAHVALKLIARYTGHEVSGVDQLLEIKVHPPLVKMGLAEDLGRVLVTNLPRVALHVLNGTDWPYLQKHVSEILGEQACHPSPLLRVIAQLPFNLLVTTNYDRLMERAIDLAMPEGWWLRGTDIMEPAAFMGAFRQSVPATAIVSALSAELPSTIRRKIAAEACDVNEI